MQVKLWPVVKPKFDGYWSLSEPLAGMAYVRSISNLWFEAVATVVTSTDISPLKVLD